MSQNNSALDRRLISVSPLEAATIIRVWEDGLTGSCRITPQQVRTLLPLVSALRAVADFTAARAANR